MVAFRLDEHGDILLSAAQEDRSVSSFTVERNDNAMKVIREQQAHKEKAKLAHQAKLRHEKELREKEEKKEKEKRRTTKKERRRM